MVQHRTRLQSPAYQDGRQAHSAGAARSTCPHAQKTPQRADWLRGYDAAGQAERNARKTNAT